MKTCVAVGQMTSLDNKKANLAVSEAIIEKAALLGARLVCLPENFAYIAKEGALHAAEGLDGETITRLRKCARLHGIWLSLGGFPEKNAAQDKVFNTHVIIDDQGELVATYRKINLFSVVLPDGSVYNEAQTVEAGDKTVVFAAPFFKGGLSICFDVRFPALFAALRQDGAEVLFIPAAFTDITGKAHWEVLLRARAIETQSYVLAAAQTGKHYEKRITHGHAMIVDPWGTVIAQCGEQQNVVVAEIDMSYVAKLRELMPLRTSR